MTDDYITIGAVSQRLGVSPDTVRRIVARGDLKATKIGVWLRFRTEDVDAYVQSCTLNQPLTKVKTIRM